MERRVPVRGFSQAFLGGGGAAAGGALGPAYILVLLLVTSLASPLRRLFSLCLTNRGGNLLCRVRSNAEGGCFKIGFFSLLFVRLALPLPPLLRFVAVEEVALPLLGAVESSTAPLPTLLLTCSSDIFDLSFACLRRDTSWKPSPSGAVSFA